MEVKEAIEFIERYRYARNSKTDEIIDLLKSLESENQKLGGIGKAWTELRRVAGDYNNPVNIINGRHEALKGLYEKMAELEEKYGGGE